MKTLIYHRFLNVDGREFDWEYTTTNPHANVFVLTKGHPIAGPYKGYLDFLLQHDVVFENYASNPTFELFCLLNIDNKIYSILSELYDKDSGV